MKLVNNASVLKQHYEKKLNELEHEKKFLQVINLCKKIFVELLLLLLLLLLC